MLNLSPTLKRFLKGALAGLISYTIIFGAENMGMELPSEEVQKLTLILLSATILMVEKSAENILGYNL